LQSGDDLGEGVDDRAEAEFEQFVRDRAPALLRVAFLVTGDAHAAEDLLQAALAKTFVAWRGLQHRQAADAYVRRVLVNTQTSWWRRRRVRETPTPTLPERAGRDRYAEVDERDRLWRAVVLLPRRQRAVVVLRFYEDLSEAEVAATLGISAGAVKSHTARGLARLRERCLPRTAEPTRAASDAKEAP
jgi:RNA polymerase sigma-70 factor (ECF subfamily)